MVDVLGAAAGTAALLGPLLSLALKVLLLASMFFSYFIILALMAERGSEAGPGPAPGSHPSNPSDLDSSKGSHYGIPKTCEELQQIVGSILSESFHRVLNWNQTDAFSEPSDKSRSPSGRSSSSYFSAAEDFGCSSPCPSSSSPRPSTLSQRSSATVTQGKRSSRASATRTSRHQPRLPLPESYFADLPTASCGSQASLGHVLMKAVDDQRSAANGGMRVSLDIMEETFSGRYSRRCKSSVNSPIMARASRTMDEIDTHNKAVELALAMQGC